MNILEVKIFLTFDINFGRKEKSVYAKESKPLFKGGNDRC